MTEILEIKGRQVGKIKTISTGNKYNVDETHPFYKQTYNLYQLNGIAFTVNSNDEFVTLKDSNKLFSADFKQGTREREIDGQMVQVPTLQLTSCTSVDFEVNMAKTESVLNKIYRDAETGEVNDDVLNSLLNA
ncbi:MAG: hypothetical protein EBR30_01515 [Cytophagia bacterium]|nr:hypothetical protein [Cytophagia bacterium]